MMTIILKGTNGCNLNCAYCSLGEKTSCEIITQDMLYKILEYGCKVAQIRNEDRINLILHGGEPTLVPTYVYRDALLKIVNEFQKIHIDISIQTNAFHITPEILSFLQEFNVNVGVSIDGSAEIHNLERKSRSGQDSYNDVIKNIEYLLDSGINVSCLMVLTSIGLNASFDYLSFFADRNLHLKINPLLSYGEVYKNPELSLKRGEYANYLIRLYEYIIQNDIEVMISPLDKLIQAAVYRKPITECTFNPKCNENFLCIDLHGDIYPCGRFSDIEKFLLGNVATASPDLMNTVQMKQLLKRRRQSAPQKCQRCKYFARCAAGCNAEAVIEGSFDQPPYLCEDYQILFRYFDGEGLRFLKNELLIKKQKLLRR